MFYLILLTIVTVTFLIFLSIVFVCCTKRLMAKDREDFLKRLVEANKEAIVKVSLDGSGYFTMHLQ